MESSPQARRFVTLSEGDLERIHAASLRVLDEVGILLESPRALALVEGAGARVDDRERRAWIPADLIEAALREAPHSLVLASGGDEALDAHMSVDGGSCSRPGEGLDFIIDAGASRRRPVTLQDATDWIRVVDGLAEIDICGGAYPWDVPVASREVRVAALMLEHTRKPLMVSGLSAEGMRWIGALLAVVPSDRGPRATVLSSVNSPLIYSSGQVGVLLESVDLGIPVCVNSSAVAGVAAPVTMAGALALMNAEMLAAVALAQIARPGAPVIYAGHPVVMDMRTGLAAFGYAEAGLVASACIDLGRFYGLPTGSDGLTTDAAIPDENAAIDKAFTAYPALMAGANVNAGAGSLGAMSTVSLEQLVIDADIYGGMSRHLRGVAVDGPSLALDVVAQVGPGGHFLGTAHTARRFREEYRRSLVACRLGAPAWEAAGGVDAVGAARERVREILETPPAPVLPESTVEQLRRIVAEAEEAMAEMHLPA